MKKTLFYLVLLTLIAACKKTPSVDCNSPTNDLALCKEYIIGKWEWAKNIQRFGGYKVSTPQTAGITRSLNFRTDGIVETYINGQLKDTATYEIHDEGKFSQIDSGKSILIFREYDYVTPRVVELKVCDDSLFLPYEALIYHTGNDYYSRVK